MYNSGPVRRADLPSTAKLIVSTIGAALVALVLLVTVVMPSEYGIDPTRVGRMLGLTSMGEIKMQLAQEAEADRQATAAAQAQGTTSIAGTPPAPASDARLDAIEKRLDLVISMLEAQRIQPQASANDVIPSQPVEPAQEETVTAVIPQDTAPVAQEPQAPANEWADEVSFTLEPGQGIELKLVMEEGAEAHFEWTANGSVLNYDTHGDGSGNKISYEKGRNVADQAGVLKAAFTGNHGWFWRNRTDVPVTLTLRVRGNYSELKRTA